MSALPQPTKAVPQTDLAGLTVLVRATLSDGVGPDLVEAVRSYAMRGARVAIVAGFGAPEGDVNPALSLRRFRGEIETASGVPTHFVADCVGPVAEAGLGQAPFGEATLLENVRFHADGRRGNRAFALRLSALGDRFAVTGDLPELPASWITALAELVPHPDAAPTRKDD